MAAPVRRNPPSVPTRVRHSAASASRAAFRARSRANTALIFAPLTRSPKMRRLVGPPMGLLQRPLRLRAMPLGIETPRQPRDPRGSEVSMKYRGIEYSVVQGTGRHIWKWSVAFDADHSEAGRATMKAEAILEAERAIDRALTPKK